MGFSASPGAAPGLFGNQAIKLKKDTPSSFQTSEIYEAAAPFTLKVKKGDSIYFSYALNPNLKPLKNHTYRFMILASKKDAAPISVFTNTLKIEDEFASGWHNEEISLDVFAGQTVTLQFYSTLLDLKGVVMRTNPEVALWGGVRIGNFDREGKEMNVILISLDTLRADHLGIQGYERPTSPNIDQLAREGVYFKEAVTVAPWTLPSHMAMLTSQYPAFQKRFLARADRPIESMSPEDKMLTEFLHTDGYITQAYTGSAYLSANFGFFRGFDRYAEYFKPARKDAAWVFGNAFEFLEKNRNKKFFLFLHTYEIHTPYVRDFFVKKLISPTKQEKWVARYDSGIRYTDRFVGQLVKKLKDLGLADNTILVLTSDHGEELKVRGNAHPHAHTLYDDLLRVPLIFYCPPKFKQHIVSSVQVQPVDIAPTLLDVLGMKIPSSYQGKSLKPILTGKAKLPEESFAFSERTNKGPYRKSIRYLSAHEKLKYILAPSIADQGSIAAQTFDPKMPYEKVISENHGQEYYDLMKDSGEISPLSETASPTFVRMKEALEKLLKTKKSISDDDEKDEPIKMDHDLKQNLKSLGY